MRIFPRPDLVFHTTAGRATESSAFAEPYQPQPVPKTEVHADTATVTLTPTQGAVGTRARLRGQGFRSGATLQIVWQTATGSRVTDEGFATKDNVFATVKVGDDGRLDLPITIPDDLGGLHGVTLRDGDKAIAEAHFVIETSIVSMTPTSGPVGTPVTIHLKGVGWTEYDNIYVATYDNGYMGYACGFNSQGDVVINFKASGPPGRTSSICIRASTRARQRSRNCSTDCRSSPMRTTIRATRSPRSASCSRSRHRKRFLAGPRTTRVAHARCGAVPRGPAS